VKIRKNREIKIIETIFVELDEDAWSGRSYIAQTDKIKKLTNWPVERSNFRRKRTGESVIS
jgi:hypothetical protein